MGLKIEYTFAVDYDSNEVEMMNLDPEDEEQCKDHIKDLVLDNLDFGQIKIEETED